ncbi:MAG: hypothetical protein F4Y07_03975 [Gemmatimonadetes bacterium]|nr:hypothetical protein [Gemmatimonadota bacterium]MYE15622.1 hypothetical protein [Gemmatimonadota bacterium]MYG22986.1 hypothetical protein [Gemmatimonadota bacterium]MYJ40095.1 hypothetical protein [Gemmatimonadota bacterium]
MTQRQEQFRAGAIALFAAVGAACGGTEAPPGPAGTPALRGALFDTIVARTERREAFSPVKNERLGFDPIAAMHALRDDVVAADTEEALYYALARVSHARRDRHLDLFLVPGGLTLPNSAGLDVAGGPDGAAPGRAPVRIFPDYSDGAGEAEYFVGDAANGAEDLVGSRVVSVNGLPIAAWHDSATAFMRHSTRAALRWKLAEAMTLATAAFPPHLRSDSLRLVLEAADGRERRSILPFADDATLSWSGAGEPSYPSLSLALRTGTYDLLTPDDGRQFLVLIWRGFRESMVADVDRLIAFASERGLLDHALVMDVTRSRGGSLGAYAMQRLQPRPFRTTFGNLRISDVTLPFIEDKRDDFAARDINDGGVPETIDDGNWLMEWLEDDVMSALERGDAYSNNVPFKLAHAPRDSDGILEPAAVHFRGPFGVISGPSGGSHLDQFVSIVVDNGLGPVVGMPPGGYSNTWEWEEVLTFPGTGQPVVGFMWSIGHTIRPNGEIAEGNPADVDEWIPLAPENVTAYYEDMLARVLELMGVGAGS